MKMFLQRLVIFPEEVLFIEIYVSYKLCSQTITHFADSSSLSAGARASPDHLRFTVSSESPKIVLKTLMNLNRSFGNHIMGF